MKKTIIAILMLLVLALGIPAVHGIAFPMPITGIVEGGNIETHIQMTNMRTGISVDMLTNAKGEFLAEWSNTPDNGGTISRIQSGDIFQVQVVGCAEQACLVSQVYRGEPEMTFLISGISAKELQVQCQKCECVGFGDWQKVGAVIAVALIMALVGWMGGGIKMYRNLRGNMVFLHRHRGIKEYHHPNTSHRNPKYRHRRWNDDPKGMVADVKKIHEQGGLI